MSDDTIWIEDPRKKPKVDPDLAYLAENMGLDASKLKEGRLAITPNPNFVPEKEKQPVIAVQNPATGDHTICE